MGLIRLFQISDILRGKGQIHGLDGGIEVRDFRGTDNRGGDSLGKGLG